jgi:signal transduction histidine kinase
VLSADPRRWRVPYADHVAGSDVTSLLAEPRAANPPGPMPRDWALVALLVLSASLEGALRPDVVWRPVVVLAVGLAFLLPWRRTHPLAVVTVAFGAVILLTAVGFAATDESVGLNTMAYVVLLPYSLFRWGSGREAALGLVFILTAYALGIASDFTGVVDAVAASVFLLFPAVVGLSVRYWATARSRELDQMKLREREQLARELHDTVAHHVSAIAIRAQAGRVVSGVDPHAAVEALEVIEQEASRTLAEMRLIVGVLRRGETAELAPQRGLADIERLGLAGHGPLVDVTMSGDLDGLPPPVGTALYRIAQESVTNAMRHARRATRITVAVTGDRDCVRLTVRDDGDPAAAARSSDGYGLVGMSERAALLGGTFEAGPRPDRGWVVDVALPRAGSPA